MRTIIASIVILGVILAIPKQAAAGVVEISVGFSFSQSTYSPESYNWTRRWGGSVGYHLSEISEIEVSFQDVLDRTKISGYEDTTFHDQIYGANWVQSFIGRNSPIQPYVKVGVGQLNREASGTYTIGGTGTASPPAVVDSLTGIIGAGAKIHLTRTFGLRAEATSYLAGGNINTWQENTAATFGLSVYF